MVAVLLVLCINSLLLMMLRVRVVGVDGVRKQVLVTSEIEIKVVLLKERKHVHGEMVIVIIPSSEHRVMLGTNFPNEFGVSLPFLKSFLDPDHHLIAFFLSPGIRLFVEPLANMLFQLLGLVVKFSMRSMDELVTIIST